MLKNKLLEPADKDDDTVAGHAVDDRDHDQLLSAATELCLIYLECEKILKKHERATGTDLD